MGGVSASFAFIGDVVIAEPVHLLVLLARASLSKLYVKRFQKASNAEFLLQHGAIDMIVDRRQMRDKIVNLCTQLMRIPAPLS